MIVVRDQPTAKTPYPKKVKTRITDVAQVVECLPSNHEALSYNPHQEWGGPGMEEGKERERGETEREKCPANVI
jgi:hypothetical protein